MAKCAVNNSQIAIKATGSTEWTDISDHCTRWSIDARVGEIYECRLTLFDGSIIQIDKRHNGLNDQPIRVDAGGESVTRVTRKHNPHSLRLATNDVISVAGHDLSDHISGYSQHVRAGELDTVELVIQCDDDVLRINGVHPWNEKDN
ncbi:hypothetical protein BJP40_06440 [Streptomyces sp. CC53]|uniref:hypothetical protein n=1 Tax=Streptomyces sp. CC53 TaxID=1906740 RepID=UPI0008DE41FA|nr:hypothetical protein [Streptomyces sp. CC53]OII61161.1 hypothetical protein BJP40_06440 [Streptomyces sp. CC53]